MDRGTAEVSSEEVVLICFVLTPVNTVGDVAHPSDNYQRSRAP